MDEIEDPNDAFDSIVMSEERFREAGYKEGFGDGQLAGQADGFRLGVESGTKVGMEIGFYSGFASTWLKLLNEEAAEEKPRASEKTLKAVINFNELVESFSIDDAQNIDLDLLTKIRSKFKQVASLLNVSPTPNNSLTKWLTF